MNQYFGPRLRHEAASWLLISELHSRHPGLFTVIEAHPGGGQYDCLTLMRGDECLAHLNRIGDFTVMDAAMSSISGDQLWPLAGFESGRVQLLDEIRNLMRWPATPETQECLPETLVYRAVAGLTSLTQAEERSWQIRSGCLDTSGCIPSGVRTELFQQFQSAERSCQSRHSTDPFGIPAYRFWFLIDEHDPLLCIENDGTIHLRNGSTACLTSLYRGLSRDAGKLLEALVGFTASAGVHER